MSPNDSAGSDLIAWKWMEKDGFYSGKTYKNLLTEDNGDPVTWKMIWRAQAPQRVRVFLWQDRLLTNVKRRRRHDRR